MLLGRAFELPSSLGFAGRRTRCAFKLLGARVPRPAEPKMARRASGGCKTAAGSTITAALWQAEKLHDDAHIDYAAFSRRAAAGRRGEPALKRRSCGPAAGQIAAGAARAGVVAILHRL